MPGLRHWMRSAICWRARLWFYNPGKRWTITWISSWIIRSLMIRFLIYSLKEIHWLQSKIVTMPAISRSWRLISLSLEKSCKKFMVRGKSIRENTSLSHLNSPKLWRSLIEMRMKIRFWGEKSKGSKNWLKSCRMNWRETSFYTNLRSIPSQFLVIRRTYGATWLYLCQKKFLYDKLYLKVQNFYWL